MRPEFFDALQEAKASIEMTGEWETLSKEQ